MVLKRFNLITPAGKTSAVPREDSKRGSRAPRADKIWVDLPAQKRARGGGGGEVVEKFVRAPHFREKEGQEKPVFYNGEETTSAPKQNTPFYCLWVVARDIIVSPVGPSGETIVGQSPAPLPDTLTPRNGNGRMQIRIREEQTRTDRQRDSQPARKNKSKRRTRRKMRWRDNTKRM